MFPARRYWRDPPSADVNASAKFYKALLNPLADHWAKFWTMDRRWLPWLGFCGLLWLIDYLYYFLLNLYENPFCECAPARPAELLVLAAVSTKKLRKMVDGERLVKDDQWYQLDLSTVHARSGPQGLHPSRGRWCRLRCSLDFLFHPSGRSPRIQPDVNQ